MLELGLHTAVYRYDTCCVMAADLKVREDDVLLTNRYIYGSYFENLDLPCQVLLKDDYDDGEPTDEVVEAIRRDMIEHPKRIIAVGGGAILDVAKFLSLKECIPLTDLFDGTVQPCKGSELILVPSTCGTGSEVTNVAVVSLVTRQVKKGLAHEALYADRAVLVPELLQALPFKVFATSSVDALVHAVESALSPAATETTKLFSYKAMEMILCAYRYIQEHGKDAREPLYGDLLTAALYAGIAFGTAGCAAVHAMSYPLGVTCHVAHGESNYAVFTNVLKAYEQRRDGGELSVFKAFAARILGVSEKDVLTELARLIDVILPKKRLREYGVTEDMIPAFAHSVETEQKRLTAHNFVTLTEADYREIYKDAF